MREMPRAKVTYGLEGLLLLFQLGGGLGKGLLNLVQLVLDLLDLLLEGTDFFLSLREHTDNEWLGQKVTGNRGKAYLFRFKVGIAGLLFGDFSSIDGIILVDLHRLHLLLDGLHFCL